MYNLSRGVGVVEFYTFLASPTYDRISANPSPLDTKPPTADMISLDLAANY